MKKFEKDGKLNFVDDANVLVGFDNTACCCESFGYHLTRSIPQRPSGDSYAAHYEYTPETVSDNDAEGYLFDRTFFKELGGEELYTEDGCAVTFRLVKPDSPDLYLTLYNSHNGYYSHGFEMSVGGTVIQDGSI